MFQRLSKEEKSLLSFWILSINDTLLGRESLDHDPFFRTLYSTLWLWPWNRPLGKPSFPLCVFGLLLVLVCMCRWWWWEIIPFSQEFSLWRHYPQVPWKKFWVEKPISPAVKNWTEKFQIYFFLQRKDSENSVIKKGILKLEAFFLSLSCVLGFWAWLWLLRAPCSVCVIHTRQGRWGGNLSPNHMIV